MDFQAQDFARFAFGEDIEGAAADFAISGEALLGERRIHEEVEFLPTERALDWFRDFHKQPKENVFEFEREANWFNLPDYMRSIRLSFLILGIAFVREFLPAQTITDQINAILARASVTTNI